MSGSGHYRTVRIAAVAAMTAGVLAMAAGAGLVYLDGRGTDCEYAMAGNRVCFRLYDTRATGLGSLTGGMALVGVGVFAFFATP